MIKRFLLYLCISFLILGIIIYSTTAFVVPEVRPPMIMMIVIFSLPLILCIKNLTKDRESKKTKVTFEEKGKNVLDTAYSCLSNVAFSSKSDENNSAETTTPQSFTKPVSSPQPEAKEPQQYIIHKNTIEKVDGEITADDVPYLIELGYQDTLRQEVNSSNPKLHRTDREEELAFNFYSKYSEQINRLVIFFENPYREELKTYHYQDKIALLELAIENFDKAKKWCYSKGKGGQIYFDDMWMNLHNSQTECFSYENQIQHRLDFIKTLIIIRQQILDIVNQTPGILQKDIYKFFDAEQKSDVVYAIKDLVKDDCILKEKKGNSYSLTALVSQDIR